MKKCIYFIFIFLFYSFLYSDDLNIFLKLSAATSKDMYLSRQIAIEKYHNCKKMPFKCLLSLEEESFDNIFWGAINRFSLRCNLLLGDRNNFLFQVGPGISFTTSYRISSFSPDIYLKLYCWLFFIFADTSFYSDGIFNKNGIGIEFKIWEIIFNLGLSNIFISDYEYSLYKLRFEIGVGYEF